MKPSLASAFALAFACAGSACGSPPPPDEPASAPQAPADVTPAPPVASAEPPNVDPLPPEPTRKEREERVIQLLEGKVPAPDLPSDSGGG